jgi:mono/diheme cytochrome c family protein
VEGEVIRSLIVLALAASAIAAPVLAAEPDGKALFTRQCGICHLKGGTGTFMLGRRLGEANALLEERRNLTAPYIRRVTRYGLNSMPRFTRAELPNSDLDAVAAYLTRAR